MERLSFSGSRLHGGGHLAAGVRDHNRESGMRCGLALDLPSASEEALHHDNSMHHMALERSGRHHPCRRTPLAERGRIRRRCMVHLLSDRHAAQVPCQSAVVPIFRATARVDFPAYRDI